MIFSPQTSAFRHQTSSIGARHSPVPFCTFDAEGRISLSDSPKTLDIKFHEGSTTVNGHMLMMVINDNDIVTEIVNLHYTPSAADKSLDANAPIYDLNGRQLPKKPAKGHYIQSGRKKYIK
ncbi:hypothetical protein SAMN04487901_1311 [Prevotella communis]|uniref:Uncharacterized protein n=1 Tax=Prevotella communis TaxID=2913614 RepID=A0A1G8CJ90_9BACT|nr:hypothetical protein [Prevotella communis]SDH44940.1 hypothetical protein SAMN04487901_1311 [Prevotella communis]